VGPSGRQSRRTTEILGRKSCCSGEFQVRPKFTVADRGAGGCNRCAGGPGSNIACAAPSRPLFAPLHLQTSHFRPLVVGSPKPRASVPMVRRLCILSDSDVKRARKDKIEYARSTLFYTGGPIQEKGGMIGSVHLIPETSCCSTTRSTAQGDGLGVHICAISTVLDSVVRVHAYDENFKPTNSLPNPRISTVPAITHSGPPSHLHPHRIDRFGRNLCRLDVVSICLAQHNSHGNPPGNCYSHCTFPS
jgi:hypothetical protein